ncbi:FGGY family carbohydrate kinase, partial [Pirellulales bacterium]|nr:FGGY family carbohydrate kinase [Pirellulales bacterium]
MANRKYVIGVDLGTQGAKAGLFREDGKTVATQFRRSKLHQPAVGVVEEDPDYQLKTVCLCIKGCLQETSVSPRQVVAVGIDGQMAGVLGIGEEGGHVTPYDSWLDTRCAPYINEMQKHAGRRITQKAGAPPSFNHGPKKLWWKHERPNVYRRIAKFVQPASYATMRLCGLTAEDAFI